AKTERISNREHPIAHARRIAGELHPREVLAAFDLEESDVRAGIGPDYLRGVVLAIVGHDIDFGCLFDDVVVGNEISVGRNEEARALAHDAPAIARHAAGPIAEEAAHET